MVEAVERLAETGYGDFRQLAGRDSEWRLRVSDQRVLFRFEMETHTIAIVRVLPRGKAYRVREEERAARWTEFDKVMVVI